MKKACAIYVLLIGLLCCCKADGLAQNFVDVQKRNLRVANAFKNKEDTLRKEFWKMGMNFPPKQMYLRSFKYDSELEVWVRNDSKEKFKLFKTYRVCALSGALGPKRIEGDYQVPEGFYFINEFKAASNYHLSLGINYPNTSDAILSDQQKPGTDIYIHGSCITVGCIPIQNEQIEELYTIAASVKSKGMDFIPVHIFPIRYNAPKSVDYFLKVSKDDKDYQKFAITLKEVFDYFEANKKLPIISINKKGEYVIF